MDQKAKNISAEGSAVIMTIAEKIYHDGKEEGIEEGIEKGKAVGKEEGRVENMHEMIEFALDLKFGMTSKSLAKDIKEIDDYEKLKEIKLAIKNYDSLDKLVKSIDI